MVAPAITRRNYERLGGSKRYVKLDYGQWSSASAFWDAVVVTCDAWFREQIAVSAFRAEPMRQSSLSGA